MQVLCAVLTKLVEEFNAKQQIYEQQVTKCASFVNKAQLAAFDEVRKLQA